MVDPINPSHISDQELINRFRKDSNTKWLGTLLERYTHLVYGICIKYLKNPEEARDGVQQIFLKVLHELPRHHVQYFKSWLYQVAKNHCLMQLRSRGNKFSGELPEMSESFEAEMAARRRMLEKDRLLNQLEKALLQLNEEQQKCIQLFYLQKKTYQEIARTTGYSLLQVKSYIQNGKRNLKILIEKMEKGQQPFL